MCLGIPMRIVQIGGDVARAEVGGVTREISLALVKNVEVGHYVIVHAGFAIEKLDEGEAMETLRLLSELAEAAGKEERPGGREGAERAGDEGRETSTGGREAKE